MPEKQKAFTAAELRAGFLVIVSGILLFVFAAAIIGYRPQRDTRTYYAHFTDVAGLNRGADVRFGGLRVGRVTDLGPAPEDQSKIRVTAEVDRDTPVNHGSTAYVGQTSLTAALHLEITTGEMGAPLLDDRAILPAGSGGLFGQLEALAGNASTLVEDLTLLVGVRDESGAPAMSDADRASLAQMMGDLSAMMDDVRLLFGVHGPDGKPLIDPEERKSLADVLTTVEGTISESNALVGDVRDVLAENKTSISTILERAEEVSVTARDLLVEVNSIVKENRGQIDEALQNLTDVLASTKEIVDDLGTLTGSIQGSLEQNTPAIGEILRSLRTTLRNLEELSRTLSEQPQALIRGKQPEGRTF